MPKLENFDQVQESTGGDFKAMEPGVYLCKITSIDTEWETSRGLQKAEDRECVRMLLDVAEGEHAGEFSRDFHADKPYTHAMYMSWTEKARGLLKHTFSAIDEANPGFDSKAAFEADKWELFVGRRLLVVWQGEEYTANNGMLRIRVRPDRAVTTADNPAIKVEQQDGTKVSWSEYRQQPPSESPTAGTYDDVPF